MLGCLSVDSSGSCCGALQRAHGGDAARPATAGIEASVPNLSSWAAVESRRATSVTRGGRPAPRINVLRARPPRLTFPVLVAGVVDISIEKPAEVLRRTQPVVAAVQRKHDQDPALARLRGAQNEQLLVAQELAQHDVVGPEIGRPRRMLLLERAGQTRTGPRTSEQRRGGQRTSARLPRRVGRLHVRSRVTRSVHRAFLPGWADDLLPSQPSSTGRGTVACGVIHQPSEEVGTGLRQESGTSHAAGRRRPARR
jgi:hypothetical protein